MMAEAAKSAGEIGKEVSGRRSRGEERKMENVHGVPIVSAAEDLRRAEAMLERERSTAPHPGKARMLAALEARIAVLRKRMEREQT